MISKLTNALLCVLLMSAGAFAQTPGPQSNDVHFSGGLLLGYHGGPGIELHGMVSNFAQDFPLSMKLAVCYCSLEPGNSADARRIFINNATNGIPEEKGRSWEFRMDFMYPVKLLNMKRAFIVGGPRYTSFLGNFKYIGGNEDFDVKSKQWGIGSGLQTFFGISNRVDLVLSGGVDYFFESTLTGHDTSYSPDGENINPREDYTYDDADEAIDQPGIEYRFQLGFSYNF